MNRKFITIFFSICTILLAAGILLLINGNKNALKLKDIQYNTTSAIEQITTNTSESNYAITETGSEKNSLPSNAETEKDISNNTTGKNNSDEQVMTVLFLGIDRTEERDESIGIFRSDTIMVARINIIDKTIKILSIPRDTYTYIPIKDKKDKINHAYAYGSLERKGVISVINAIENFIQKIKIDNYFSLEMEPFPDIIDDIGGVELDVEIDMKTHGADLSKGYQLLDGKKAFDYIHWRYSSNGDIGRIERQHKFIKALVNKMNNSEEQDLLINILLKYIDYYEMDFTLEEIKVLVDSIKGIKGEDIKFYSIPGKDETINGIWYWVPNSEKMEQVISDFYS